MLQTPFDSAKLFIHTHPDYKFQVGKNYLMDKSDEQLNKQLSYMHSVLSGNPGEDSPALTNLISSIACVDKGPYFPLEEKDNFKSVILKDNPDFLGIVAYVTDSKQFDYNPDRVKKMVMLYLFDDARAFNLCSKQLKTLPPNWSQDIHEPSATISAAYNSFLEILLEEKSLNLAMPSAPASITPIIKV